MLPLLKPALVAALVYSFVRSMTTVSAVIFLVTAENELATTYIIGRVGNGDYGVALAYCTVLIVLMSLGGRADPVAGRRAQAAAGAAPRRGRAGLARREPREPRLSTVHRTCNGHMNDGIEFRDVTKRYGARTRRAVNGHQLRGAEGHADDDPRPVAAAARRRRCG